jgi:hypothetical protein
MESIPLIISAFSTAATVYSTIEQTKAAKKQPQQIQQPKQVQQQKEQVMPMADDDAMRKAKKQSLLSQLSRGGRDSTILSGGGSATLG